MRTFIESQLLSYLGSPVIPQLTQDDNAVSHAFIMGIADYWITCPTEIPHSMNASAGTLSVPINGLVATDIPDDLKDNYYVTGITYMQYNPVSAILGTPYSSATGASSIDYMIMGTNARNLGGSAYNNNIMTGYTLNDGRNPFTDVARGSVSSNILRKTAFDKMTNWSGINGSVEYRYDTINNAFVFNFPISSSGIFKYIVGYGFSPKDLGSDASSEDKLAELDKVIALIPHSYLPLLANYVTIRFLDTIIAARGSVNFGGSDYTIDVSRLESIKSKKEQELQTMSLEFAPRILSWQ